MRAELWRGQFLGQLFGIVVAVVPYPSDSCTLLENVYFAECLLRDEVSVLSKPRSAGVACGLTYSLRRSDARRPSPHDGDRTHVQASSRHE